MGFFDFLFGKKLTIEHLVKLDEEKLTEELQRSSLKDLQKLCLTRCQDLNTEEKQKMIYVNAIMNIIREIKEQAASSPNSAASEVVQNAFESKPVNLQRPAPMAENDSVMERPPAEEPMPENGPGPAPGPYGQKPPPMGGKRTKKGGNTKRRKEKKEPKHHSKKNLL